QVEQPPAMAAQRPDWPSATDLGILRARVLLGAFGRFLIVIYFKNHLYSIISNVNLVRSNAKWDYDAHIAFIEVCEREIRKGNRPNTHLNKDGWKNLGDAFYNRMGRKYTKTQLKNKWDNMKQDWAFYNQLMRENTGLGWDATKNTIIADDDWWNQKIKVDHRYRRFRNMVLSLIRYRYDALFSDIVATG
ncbi:hypothetical protein FXO38_30460, partial [Capsicum annuum]